MDSDFLIKFSAPITSVIVGILGAITALLAFWQKRKSHRIELAEKLYLALKEDSKLLAMEAFYQLAGLRYPYPDIKILFDDDDMLQRLIMLKRRKDAVTFSEGKYNYVKSYKGASRSIYYFVNWFFFVASLALTITVIIFLFKASIAGKFIFTTAGLLAATILLCVYSAREIYWYREADRVLNLEAEKQLEIKQAKS